MSDPCLELVRQLVGPASELERRDRDLASRLRLAASSVVLNVAEGLRSDGPDQRYHFRVAAGSAEEARACLQDAAAGGHLDEAGAAALLETVERVATMLLGLAR